MAADESITMFPDRPSRAEGEIARIIERRHGSPRDADLVFDVRFLANPHYDLDPGPLTGKDEQVGKFIFEDDALAPFFDKLTTPLEALPPRSVAEGKRYRSMAVRCIGGRHRSVFVAERRATWLGDRGQRAQTHHRDLDRP